MATKTSQLGLTKPAYTDAADIAVLNGNFDLIDKAVGQGARVGNLLDNSWFVNPINQRGASSYTNNGHTIDRWRDTTNSTTLITANGLTLQNNSTTSNAYWRQRLPTSVLTSGKTYTMAVEVGGVVCCGHAVVNSTSTATFYGANGLYLSCTGLTDNTYWTIQIALSAGKTFTGVRWAALYEGAYTADTLPAYVYKGYAAELAECQRYYLHVGSSYSDWLTVSYAQGWGIIMEIPSPMTMRATPSAVVLDEGIKVFLSSGWTAANSITVSTYRRGGSVFLLLSGTNGAIGLDAGKTYLAAGLAGLSADL